MESVTGDWALSVPIESNNVSEKVEDAGLWYSRESVTGDWA